VSIVSRQPVAVNKYLLPAEHAVVTVKSHPAVLIAASAEAVSSVAMALILNGTLAHTPGLKLVVFVPVVFLWIRLAFAVVRWLVDFIVVTPQRLLNITGFFYRKVESTPLDQISDISLERRFSGRLLGFGDLVTNSGGTRKVVASGVPYPEQLYLEISAMLHPDAVGDNSDDRGPATTRPPSPPWEMTLPAPGSDGD
jgi:hypothetical protein